MTPEPSDTVPAIERAATTVVDTLLARVAPVARNLDRPGEWEAIDRDRARLAIADLALVATLVRALNRAAADRLTEAATALRQAREEVERHPEDVLR